MSFELLLFCADPARARRAERAGVDGLLVDWETAGKHRRQHGADTEINHDTVEDLKRVRQSVRGRVICRVNAPGPWTGRELEVAIEAGADEVLVPMVRSAHELERILDQIRGRCAVGCLIETSEAVARCHEIGSLPLARVYVGLNDLAIDRGTPSIFSAVADGTLERVREAICAPFGFGGLTLPELGEPVPCRSLIGEMARLGCEFSFLRRSYKRDVPANAQLPAIRRIREALAAASLRDEPAVRRDRRRLIEVITAIETGGAAARHG